MSLVALDGTPLVLVGAAGREGNASFVAGSTSVLMDAANEAAIYLGQIFTEDGASHTIDTTGSSSLGWLTAAVTFANAGTTVKVGLAAVDTAAGPPGRATNSTNVITFDVSKTMTGSGTPAITANTWQEHVPDAGTKTVANGDFIAFAVQMTARAGVDVVNTNNELTSLSAPNRPAVTAYTGGSYAVNTAVPNAVITFSDGVRGYFFGGAVFSSFTGQTYNSGSGTNEYGNFFQSPFPMNVYGQYAAPSVAGGTSNYDFVLYTDPLGTPASAASVAFDANTVGSTSIARWTVGLFATPVALAANQPVAAIIKPTTANNITANYVSMNLAAHQKSLPFGTNGYAVNRGGGSGAFAAQNSSKDRVAVGLIVGAFDTGGGGGSVFGAQGGTIT